jgi:hypothetical protein
MGHIMQAKAQHDVSNFFVVKLCAIGFLQSRGEARRPQKALFYKAYFIASSTWAATAI